jgi:integrase
MALTSKRIGKLSKPGRYRDPDTRGLYLQVGRTGTKSWLLRYELNGRERFHGLGSLDDFSLKEARERARAARQKIADGIDPIDARQAERAEKALAAAKALTFEEAARKYFDQHERKWRNDKHRAQFLSTLTTYVFPTIGKLPVSGIETGHVLRVLEPIWHEKTETANRVRGRIESILDWATVREYRTGANPARWRGHLGEVLPARSLIAKSAHHPALPYAEMPEFMAALMKREGVAARALEFTILTAARTGEVIGAQWSEIDFNTNTWTVPAGRMKSSKEHRVPLSERTVEILKALPFEKDNPFVFIGPRTRGLSNMAMASVLKRMDRHDITVHGFRSSFRDWAAERTNYPNHVVEQALAHVIGNKVEAAYRRGDLFDRRQRLMEDWSRYCTSEPEAGNVLQMAAAR